MNTTTTNGARIFHQVATITQSSNTTSAAVPPVWNEAPPLRIDGQIATLRLYDSIDSWGEFWGVSANEFATVLDELPNGITDIHLHINSPGGEVYDGIAILNALRLHPARVTAFVDGIAASAASFIAVGVDETVMGPNTEMMIHEAWGLCVGDSQEMRRMADLLDRHSDNVASIYAAKTGQSVDAWRDVMRGEAWYSADEAVAAGLADRVNDPDGADGQVSNRFDLSAFNYPGRQAAPAPPKISTETPDPVPADSSSAGADPAVDVVPSVGARTELARIDQALLAT